jgi:hypothetical protein
MRREWSAKARAVVLINVPLRSVPNLVNKSNYLSFVPYPLHNLFNSTLVFRWLKMDGPRACARRPRKEATIVVCEWTSGGESSSCSCQMVRSRQHTGVLIPVVYLFGGEIGS